MKKILSIIFIVVIVLSTNISIAKIKFENTSLDITDIDVDNSRKTSYWTNIPIVSKKLLEKEEVTIGGEGCQWPLCMASSNDGKYLFYGTDVAGIYKSADNGKTWDKSIKNFTAAGASDIVVDPKNSDRIIAFGVNAVAQYTTGIYLSEDGGETWSFKQNFMVCGHRDVSENIAYDASSYDNNLGYSKIAYISIIYEKDIKSNSEIEITDEILKDYTDGKSKCNKAGLYKTEDGGNTWNMISNTLYDGIVKVNPKTGTVYIARNDGLYISTNKGKSFKKINSEKILGLDIVENENNVKVYYSTNEGIFYSENDGENFKKIESINFPMNSNRFPQNIKVSPLNNNYMIMYFGEEMFKNDKYNPKGDIYYSQNGGKTWNISKYDDSYNFMHYIFERIPNFIWSTNEENKVWTFTNDWISSSNNGGEIFKWDANGLNAILVGGQWKFNIYNSDIIYLGSQDYNGVVTLDGGNTWKYIDLYTYSNDDNSYNWPHNGFVYGGYAADELTYFGAALDQTTGKRYLTITHDGGKTHTAHIGEEEYELSGGPNNILQGQANYSSYQSAKNPKILFCGDLKSEDGGYTWSRMLDKEGKVAVTGVYTHDIETGRLFGVNAYTGRIVYSDDDGQTWEQYNKESLNPWWEPVYVDDLEYDTVNDILYVAWGWTSLSTITDNGNVVTNITNRIPKMLQFEGAPTKEQIGSNYNETRIRTVAVDSNNPSIVYAGGSCYGYRGDSSIYRSCDSGKTWNVVSINSTNSIVSKEDGDYGGVEPVCINVKPETGELWSAGNCTGLSKLTPPYTKKQDNEENNNTDNEENNNIGNEENNNIDSEQENNIENKEDNTQSNKPLPQTGGINNWIIDTIAILGIVAIIVLYKIKHTK